MDKKFIEINQTDREEAMEALLAVAPFADLDHARPVYHFRPPAQWMNDVHAFFYHSGYYHVFFQLYCWSEQIGSVSDRPGCCWGHAKSKDLVHWEFLGPGLMPLAELNEKMLASGSAYIRKDGTPMLFYTHTPYGTPENKREAWGALPVDGEFLDWERIDIGLAAGKSGIPEDIWFNWADMFVFQKQGRVFATFKACDGMVVEAQNEDLTSWKAVGNLGGHETDGLASDSGVAGECPNLFPLAGQEVLIRSTYPISYLIGSFDPNAVKFEVKSGPFVLDYAYGGDERPENHFRGLYGTSVYTNPDGMTILLGWVSGFKSGRGWKGCMSLPRVLRIENQRLIQEPLPELTKLRGNHVRLQDKVLKNESLIVDGAEADALEIKVIFEADNNSSFGVKIRCSTFGDRGIIVQYSDGVLNVGGTEVPLKLQEEDNLLTLHLFHDRSVLEVFIQNGKSSVTRVDYPLEEDLSVQVFTAAGSCLLRSLDFWELSPIW